MSPSSAWPSSETRLGTHLGVSSRPGGRVLHKDQRLPFKPVIKQETAKPRFVDLTTFQRLIEQAVTMTKLRFQAEFRHAVDAVGRTQHRVAQFIEPVAHGFRHWCSE